MRIQQSVFLELSPLDYNQTIQLTILMVSFASLMEGLTYGIGDAVIGLNPVDDSTDSVVRLLNKFEEFRSKWDVPTQTCVLAREDSNGSNASRRSNWSCIPIYRRF